MLRGRPSRLTFVHVLVALASLAAGAAFWFYRLRAVGGAARSALGAAQTAKGARTRRRLAAESDFAPIAAIDAAPVAAATWMRLQMDLIEGEDHRDAVEAFLTEAAGPDAAGEAVTYAAWAAGRGVDPARAVGTLRAKLEGWLDEDELARLGEAFAALEAAGH